MKKEELLKVCDFVLEVDRLDDVGNAVFPYEPSAYDKEIAKKLMLDYTDEVIEALDASGMWDDFTDVLHDVMNKHYKQPEYALVRIKDEEWF